MVKKGKKKRIFKYFDYYKLEPTQEIYAEDMYQWMNLNKNTNVVRSELAQLLRLCGFQPSEWNKNQITKWKYEGNKNVVDRKI